MFLNSTYEKIYNDEVYPKIVKGEKVDIQYHGYTIRLRYCPKKYNISSYSSGIKRNNDSGTDCTIYMNRTQLLNREYSLPILFHEIGHLINGDLDAKYDSVIEDERITNLFSIDEFNAWLFAAKNIKMYYVIKSIDQLGWYSMINHPDAPFPSLELYSYEHELKKSLVS